MCLNFGFGGVLSGDIDITLLGDGSIQSGKEILNIQRNVKWMPVDAGNGARQKSLLVESTGWA